MRVLAIFGPTAVGKTGVAIEVAELLRERGEDPVAVSCDAIQVYRGLEILSGAATAAERERLEHRLIGFVPIDEEFSAGRFAKLAHAGDRPADRRGPAADRRRRHRPLHAGGAGRARAAPAGARRGPRGGRGRARRARARGPARRARPELASGVHPNDRKRIARLTELARLGIAPARIRRTGSGASGCATRPLLVGLTVDRELLRTRIDARVDAMVAARRRGGGRAAPIAPAPRAPRGRRSASRSCSRATSEAMKRAQWRYARRQLTWMRRMEDVTQIDRSGRDDADVAAEIVARLR